MNFSKKTFVAAAAAVALAGASVFAGAGSASAATVTPVWVGSDSAKGGVNFYDAAGNQITGGANINNIAAYLSTAGAAASGSTRANAAAAVPDHTAAAPYVFSQNSLPTTNYLYSPAATGVPATVSSGGKAFVALTTGGADALGRVGAITPDATAGYANTLEIRVADNGTGNGTAALGGYWRTVIEYNATTAPVTSYFDTTVTLAANAWRVVFPVLTVTNTATSAPTFSPVSPVASGASVTLSSTVTPAGATGSVHFFDGATDLGAATYNSTTGVATLPSTFTNATAADVAHSITAQFTPAGLYGSSTSSASSLTVQRVPLINTTTTMTVSQATVTLGSADVLTATAAVTPASGAAVSGTVSFYVDGSSTANATKALVPANNGSTGAVTINFSGLTGSSSPGTAHTIVATFTDGTTWSGSSSAASTVNVIASYASDTQNIQTSITAGTITIATPYYLCSNAASNFTGFPGGVKPSPCTDNPLVLPAMTLNSTATEYSTTAAFTGISVADTRPGNLAYTIQAISSNLTKVGVTSPSASQTINAQNVGLNISSLTSTNATPNTFLG